MALTIQVQLRSKSGMRSQAVSLFAAMPKRRTCNCCLDINPAVPPTVLGDPLRIRQILANLISNAIKFTDSGSVRVAVTREPVSGNRLNLYFAVTDTGIGLSQTGREKLFHAFYQMDQSYRRRYSGTGLGLAISKQLVEQLGGEIGVESRPRRGATFWFRLPGEVPQTATVRPEAATAPARPDYDGLPGTGGGRQRDKPLSHHHPVTQTPGPGGRGHRRHRSGPIRRMAKHPTT